MGTIEIVSTDYSIFAAFYEDLFVFQFCYIYWIIEHAEETTQAGSPLYETLNANFIKKLESEWSATSSMEFDIWLVINRGVGEFFLKLPWPDENQY